MISIKRFLDTRHDAGPPNRDLLEASLQMGRLLLDAIATHVVRGRETDLKDFTTTLSGLLRRTEEPPTPLHLLSISSEATEALETYCQRTTEYSREQTEQMQTMVTTLADTLADLSGQTDASVSRLQALEQQIEHASGLEDMGTVSTSLQNCLQALREAVAQQRTSSAATTQRLQGRIEASRQRMARDRTPPRRVAAEIDLEPEPAGSVANLSPSAYVAAFRLQRAEHIATRFGEGAKHQMLSLISQTLKPHLGPNDRLLRWKGTSFVMFLNTTESIHQVRVRLSEVVVAICQQYIEVGKKSTLLSVGVDWIVFPQSQCPSIDAVFTEVDSFLANARPGNSSALAD